MGDGPGIWYRGNNGNGYIDWLKVLDSGNTSFTRTLTSGTKIGSIKINGISTDIYCQTNTDTNYYHSTGSWSGLTYTATANGGAPALAFTIPTGTTSTTVAVGNHTHNYAGSSSAGGAASSLAGFKITTTSSIGIDSTTVEQAIGYVGGLTKADWNYQNTDGALYKQTYSANWIHQIFGDYRTGQISIRGRNNGTWKSWRRVLDEFNYSSIITGYATSDHTHTTTIAAGASSDTNQLTLAFGTKYKLTAGGTNFIFTTPSNPNTDRYVNSASFAHDSTNNNVKMTLTRAGSDTNTVTANIPKVSSSTAGVVPKGASVSSQS
jgi:hypothetical protein